MTPGVPRAAQSDCGNKVPMPLPELEEDGTDADVSGDLARLRLRLAALEDRVAALRVSLQHASASIVALDRLSHGRAKGTPPTPRPSIERWEAEAAELPSEAWEISLISEEG